MRDEAALEIGALAVHLKDPANVGGDTVIYAGTGKPNEWSGYPGVGVLKSVELSTRVQMVVPSAILQIMVFLVVHL